MTPSQTAEQFPADQTSGADFAADLLAGLRGEPKTLHCKYFYDTIGSDLFEQICELPEYYPTRTELALLRARAGEVSDLIGPDAELVEFGAGASVKVRILLDALVRPAQYVPIDIAGDFVRAAAAGIAKDYPNLAVHPVAADFTRPMALPPSVGARKIGFFPGSTIGNFVPEEAQRFLSHAARLLRGGALLIGVDLVKDPAVLHAAYNDGAGVTAAFNKNVLARANRELGADFDLDRFAHHAPYNPLKHRVEMYLISRQRQTVTVAGESFDFAEGEAVHTEYSHKHTIDGFRALAARAGFSPRAVWTDPNRLFSLHWLESV